MDIFNIIKSFFQKLSLDRSFRFNLHDLFFLLKFIFIQQKTLKICQVLLNVKKIQLKRTCRTKNQLILKMVLRISEFDGITLKTSKMQNLRDILRNQSAQEQLHPLKCVKVHLKLNFYFTKQNYEIQSTPIINFHKKGEEIASSRQNKCDDLLKKIYLQMFDFILSNVTSHVEMVIKRHKKRKINNEVLSLKVKACPYMSWLSTQIQLCMNHYNSQIKILQKNQMDSVCDIKQNVNEESESQSQNVNPQKQITLNKQCQEKLKGIIKGQEFLEKQIHTRSNRTEEGDFQISFETNLTQEHETVFKKSVQNFMESIYKNTKITHKNFKNKQLFKNEFLKIPNIQTFTLLSSSNSLLSKHQNAQFAEDIKFEETFQRFLKFITLECFVEVGKELFYVSYQIWEKYIEIRDYVDSEEDMIAHAYNFTESRWKSIFENADIRYINFVDANPEIEVEKETIEIAFKQFLQIFTETLLLVIDGWFVNPRYSAKEKKPEKINSRKISKKSQIFSDNDFNSDSDFLGRPSKKVKRQTN